MKFSFSAIIGFLVGILFLTAQANAAGPLTPNVNTSLSSWFSHFLAPRFQSKDYQIGSEWGKKKVTPDAVANENEIFRRAALATARYGGGTAFYLGKFNGQHLMGTNHHVQPDTDCGSASQFVLLGKSFRCTEVFGSWPEIDFALYAIRVPFGEEVAMMEIARSFSFSADIFPGQPILTVGFGIAQNPNRDLMANQDSDCYVFSDKNEFRSMGDPDEYNPGPYKAWSFATGCDVSHGDSGSAFVDRSTGDVIGLVWTGKIPKSDKIRDSRYLDEIFKNRSEEIWKELTFAVPAAKIHEVLEKFARESTDLSDAQRATLAAWLN